MAAIEATHVPHELQMPSQMFRCIPREAYAACCLFRAGIGPAEFYIMHRLLVQSSNAWPAPTTARLAIELQCSKPEVRTKIRRLGANMKIKCNKKEGGILSLDLSDRKTVLYFSAVTTVACGVWVDEAPQLDPKKQPKWSAKIDEIGQWTPIIPRPTIRSFYKLELRRSLVNATPEELKHVLIELGLKPREQRRPEARFRGNASLKTLEAKRHKLTRSKPDAS